jgi:peptidoglycan hydrolase-like protein with peptidoglycan-binding domain
VPAAVDPSETAEHPPSTVTGKSGHHWLVVLVTAEQEPKLFDVIAPAGEWGPHEDLRVVRYSQAGSDTNSRTMVAAADGVPSEILAAAVSDFGIKIPAPTVAAPPGRPPMPASLQQEMIATLRALGVDANGNITAPATVTAVRQATELASRLQQAGYPEAANLIRQYAVTAAQAIPTPPPAQQPPMPAGIPAELQAQIARAIELERDPAKLQALRNALLTYPQSDERDMLVNLLDAIIRDVQTQQAVASAATDVDRILTATSPGLPTGSNTNLPAAVPTPPSVVVAPSVPALPVTNASLPALVAQLGTRTLSLAMKGDDVKAWQQILGLTTAPITADGLFGAVTNITTKKYQTNHGLTADGLVGPLTKASVLGTAVTAPASVPAPAPVATTSSARLLKLTSPNMTGSDVKSWQQVLIDSGYAMTADGIFGSKTDAATRDWQSKHGLTADGIVGPATRAKIGTAPNAPLAVPATPSAQPLPAAKSPREVAADAMAAHLLQMQSSYGVAGSKSRFDKNMVIRFQKEAGLTQDGLPGTGTLTAAAQAGVGILPKVMYWPAGATKTNLTAYRNGLESIAAKAASLGFTTLAAQIRASAAAETGQGSAKGSL